MARRKCTVAFLAVAAALLHLSALSSAAPTATFDGNRPTALQYIGFTLNMDLEWPADENLAAVDALYCQVLWNGTVIGETNTTLTADDVLPASLRVSELSVTKTGNQPLTVLLSYSPDMTDPSEQEYVAWVISGGVSILPPLFVIVFAIVTQEVLLALFVGLFVAGSIVHQGNILQGFLMTLNYYLVESLGNVDHAFVIMFSWFLAGLVACVQKSGGGHGIANALMSKISSRRGIMLAVFFMGFIIFFDDYANTLILGSTMRGVADSFFVSREKLAFLVDATTAPVASIAPISSWIGFEVGLINEQITNLEQMGYGDQLAAAGVTSGYNIFLESIASRYYPIFMLLFQFWLIFTTRDLGPMLRAERRAMDKKQVSGPDANESEVELDTSLEPEEDVPRLWWNSAVPIVLTLIIVFTSLLVTGYKTTVDLGDPVNAANLFGNGDSYSSLLYGSFIGSVFTWLFIRAQYYYKGEPYNAWKCWFACKRVPIFEDGTGPKPILTLKESLEVWIEGIKGLTTPVLVLIMAWAIGQAVQDVSCDLFFASALSSDSLDYRMLPTLTFLISALISFCTGTSWGTMSIMFPLAVPASWISSGGDKNIFVMTVAGILAGAVFGDHATAISDTTILSSLATKCDLRHHVITQLPYAVICGVFSVLLGTIPGAYIYPPWVGLLIGFPVMAVLPLLIGQRVDHPLRKLDPISSATEWMAVKWFKKEPHEVYIPDDVNTADYKDFWTAIGVAKKPEKHDASMEGVTSAIMSETKKVSDPAPEV